MKRIILALIIFLTTVSGLQAQYQGPENITCKEASDLIQRLSKNNSFVILDLRPENMFKEEHIKNAVFRDVFADGFEDWLNDLDKDQTYLLYCNVGYRSGIAMERMKQAGFKNLHHLYEGIQEWKKQGFPTIRESN